MFSSRMPICVNCNAGAHSLCNMIWCLCRKLNLSPMHPKIEMLIAARPALSHILFLFGFAVLLLATVLYYTFPVASLWDDTALLAAYSFFTIRAAQEWKAKLG